MTTDGKQWWKGSFPTWLVAGLLGVIGFIASHMLDEQKRINEQVLAIQVTLAEHNVALKYHEEMLKEYKHLNERIVEKLENLLVKNK